MELQQVIEGCRQGDRACQQRLYEMYSARYFAVCLRYAASRDEAEDILVEGFCKVFTQIHTYSAKGSVEGWMYRIFMNEAISHYRSRLQYQQHFVDVDDVAASTLSSTEHYDEAIDVSQAVDCAMGQLTKRERMVFNLVAVEGYMLREVARRLRIPLSTVKTCYYRARTRLTATMEQLLGRDYMPAGYGQPRASAAAILTNSNGPERTKKSDERE